MAAKPQITVRLTPSVLHALAYVAERTEQTPAELARELVAAGVQKLLAARTWQRDWEDCYRQWQREQGAIAGRPEAPAQGDYNDLADGKGFPAHPAVGAMLRDRERTRRPLGDTIAADSAHIQRVSAARAGLETRD